MRKPYSNQLSLGGFDSPECASYPTARQADNERIPVTVGGERVAELPARVAAIAKAHVRHELVLLPGKLTDFFALFQNDI